MNYLSKLLPARGSGGRQAAFVVIGDAITILALTLTSMVLARTIQPGDMATFRQIVYLGPLVVSLGELGISGTVYRYYRVYRDQQLHAFLRQVLAALLALGLLGSLILLVLAYPLSRSFANPELGPALLITCGQVLTSLPFLMVRPVLINQGFSLKATLWEAGLAVGASLALILPLWHGWSLNQGLVCWMLANAARLLVVWWYVGRPYCRRRHAWDSALTREVWSYLWPIQLSRLPGIIMAYFDKVVTSIFLAKPAFAAYSLGARDLPFVSSISGSVSSVLLPRMVEAFQEDKVDRVCGLWRKACISTALVTYPAAVFCMWHARPIIRAMFTVDYEAGAIPFAAYACMTIIRVVDYGSLARALNQNTITLRIATYSMLLSLPLAAGLTWAFGIWGISLSLLLSTALMAVLYLWAYARVLKRPVHCFYPFGPLGTVLLLAFASVLLSDYALGSHLGLAQQPLARGLLPRLFLLFLATSCIYGSSLWLLMRLRPRWIPTGV